MKKTLLIAGVAISTLAYAQNVNIPDANFKAYLVGNTSINTNSDTEIQVTEATAFTGAINCGSQSISDFTGIEAFVNITEFNSSQNPVTSLDLSANTALDIFYCSNCSQLFNLNIANGNNSNMSTFYADVCPNLSCIQVDDVAWSTTNWTVGNNIDATASFSTNCPPCVVNIPDANFKAYLVGNTSINTNSDTEIQCEEAFTYTGQIDCSGLGITDLTGIEAFKNLTILYCQNTPTLTSVNLSNNTALTDLRLAFCGLTSLDVTNNYNLNILHCYNNQLTSLILGYQTTLGTLNCFANQLTSLDVSGATYLTSIQCYTNQLTALDVTSHYSLTNLVVYGNQLASLDVSANSALTTLRCGGNSITSLDVSNNTSLTDLECPSNQISALDVSNNTALSILDFGNNQITSINLSGNTALTILNCVNNQIGTLDLSNNTALVKAYCKGNTFTSLDVSASPNLNLVYAGDNSQLTELNVANGNNTNFANTAFNALNSTSLTCITVDDVAYSTTNWTNNIDAGASFSTDCTLQAGLEDNTEFTITIYPNPADDVLFISSDSQASSVTIIDVTGAIVYNQKFQNGRVDVSNLPQGYYFIQVETSKGIVQKSFVKA